MKPEIDWDAPRGAYPVPFLVWFEEWYGPEDHYQDADEYLVRRNFAFHGWRAREERS